MKRKNSSQNSAQQSNPKRIPKYILWSLLWILVFVFITLLPFVHNPLLAFTTWLTNTLLNLLGLETMVSGYRIALLTGSEMKFSIILDCTGIYPFVILTALMISFPTAFKKRVIGVVGALLTTFVFNTARLILLIYIGHSSRENFQYAHVFIFQITFILLIVIYYLWWLSWIQKKTT